MKLKLLMKSFLSTKNIKFGFHIIEHIFSDENLNKFFFQVKKLIVVKKRYKIISIKLIFSGKFFFRKILMT